MKIHYAMICVPERNPLYVKRQLEQCDVFMCQMPRALRKKKGHEQRKKGVSINFRNAMADTNGADYRVVVHDDLDFIDNFEAIMMRICEAFKDKIILGYAPNTPLVRTAAEKGLHAVKTRNVWPQVTAIPLCLNQRYQEWYKTGSHWNRTEDDNIQDFMRAEGIHAIQIVNSLAQHRGYNTSSFGIPGAIKGVERRSITWDPSADLLSVNWEAVAAGLE